MALPALFQNAEAVTPHDTNPNDFESLYVGGAGNVRVLTEGGQDVVFSGVPAGTVLYVRVKKVFATNTTATLIIGLR